MNFFPPVFSHAASRRVMASNSLSSQVRRRIDHDGFGGLANGQAAGQIGFRVEMVEEISIRHMACGVVCSSRAPKTSTPGSGADREEPASSSGPPPQALRTSSSIFIFVRDSGVAWGRLRGGMPAAGHGKRGGGTASGCGPEALRSMEMGTRTMGNFGWLVWTLNSAGRWA